MLQNIMGFLKKIDDNDPALDIRKRILNIVLLSISLLSLFSIVATLLGPPDPVNQVFLVIISIFLFLCTIVFIINQYVSVFLAGSIFTAILTISILIIDTPEELIQGRSLFFTSIPIVAAGILLRPIGSFIVAIFTATFMYYLSVRDQIIYNTFGLAGFITLALFSWLAASRLENALRSLKSINITLDRRVSERTKDLLEANNQLASANKRLTDLDQLKSKFVADISHELRTPISNITIYLDMLQSNTVSENKQRYLGVLQDETTRLATLIEDILDLSKIEMAGRSLDIKNFDLCEMINQIIISNKYVALEKGIEIFTEFENIKEIIEGDPIQISQAINNLVINAINYSEEGEIKVKVLRKNSNVEITVVDKGMGIAEEDKEHLFERFYRGRNASLSTIPGTGLGLSITKEIIDLHKGEIRISKNTEGKGTIISILLPVNFSKTV